MISCEPILLQILGQWRMAPEAVKPAVEPEACVLFSFPGGRWAARAFSAQESHRLPAEDLWEGADRAG
jgi:hypothetical protein